MIHEAVVLLFARHGGDSDEASEKEKEIKMPRVPYASVAYTRVIGVKGRRSFS